MLKKIIFFFSWIGIFFISLFGIAYIVAPSHFTNIDTGSFLFKAVVFNICLVYIFVSILKLLSNFKKQEDYVMKNEHGSVHISTDTVKNLIKDQLSQDRDIKSYKIDCGNKGKKYFVKINLDLISNDSLSVKTIEIQENVKELLESKLDLKVDKIEVKISKVSIKKDLTEV